MTLRILSAEHVRNLLPMGECIEVMAAAMAAASAGTVSIPPRLITPLIDKSGFLALMPGSSRQLGVYGAKVVSLHPTNPQNNRPAIQGFVTLFDHHTGAPVAIIEGAEITAIRTAAASGLATQLLAREDVHTCGILGTGVQAVTHIDAICAVRPISEILVWGRDSKKTADFAAAQAHRTGVDIRSVEDPALAARCDVVCTVTGSPTPILKGEWVRTGAHVNLVGAHSLSTREADTDLIKKSAVYIDLLSSVKNEGGDIMLPIQEGAIDESHIIGEIGQLVEGRIPGRASNEQITLYNSLGITAQDLFAARHIYANAQANNVGERVDL